MSPPSEIRIVELLRPYLDEHLLTDGMLTSLRTYLDLILKWNAHTNLTAIRDPEELVQRQIGESLFAGGLVPLSGTLLDFGSGAGFPGVPLQILRPGLKVTLAESQGKKASFLREAVRTLCLPCEVWARRVEQMPAGRGFDAVVMRAVDATEAMLPVAANRVGLHGALIRFTAGGMPHEPSGWQVDAELEIPLSMGRISRLKRL